MRRPRTVGGDVSELRFFFGPGYRVDDRERGDDMLVLWAGDKSTQDRDIIRALAIAAQDED